MPRPAKLSKTGLAEKLCPVFEHYGYDGASLALLAAAAGLSKASLYHHFPRGKEDMALYALAHAGARLQQLVLGPLMAKAAGADRLRQSLDGTARYYTGDVPVCLMNSLLLGTGRDLFAAQIGKAVGQWRQLLAKAADDDGFETPDGWAGHALERIQGALVLCRVEGNRAPLDACLKTLMTEVGDDV